MATSESTQAVPAASVTQVTTSLSQELANEIVVSTGNGGYNWSEYQGTSALLKAEGVIPDDIEWPSGDRSVRWSRDGMDFSLSRHRPAGMKGPKKAWVNGDWWRLMWNPTNAPDILTQNINRKAAELQQLIFQRSPAGRLQANKDWQAICQTFGDRGFQAFKAALLPKRSRG